MRGRNSGDEGLCKVRCTLIEPPKSSPSHRFEAAGDQVLGIRGGLGRRHCCTTMFRHSGDQTVIPRKLPHIDICYAPAGSSYFDSVCFVNSTEGFLRILVCRGTFTTVDAQISSQQLSWRCNLRWVPIVLLTESQSPRQRESLADRIASRNLRSRSLPGSGRSNSAVPASRCLQCSEALTAVCVTVTACPRDGPQARILSHPRHPRTVLSQARNPRKTER